MSEKIVTHEDLDALLDLRNVLPDAGYERGGRIDQIVDRFIAAAEADAPPLPEGWYELANGARLSHAYVHSNGQVSRAIGGVALANDHLGTVEEFRDYLTPLRPTVTEADVERAARAARAVYLDGDTWDEVTQDARDGWMKIARAALDTLGIEVQP